MRVETVGKILKIQNIETIKKRLKHLKYKNIKTTYNNDKEGMYRVTFKTKNNERSLFMIKETEVESDDEIFGINKSYTNITLKLDENNESIEIMENLISLFGGFIIPRDCEDPEKDGYFRKIDKKLIKRKNEVEVKSVSLNENMFF